MQVRIELKIMLRSLAMCRVVLVKGTANQSEQDFSNASMLNSDAYMSD